MYMFNYRMLLVINARPKHGNMAFFRRAPLRIPSSVLPLIFGPFRRPATRPQNTPTATMPHLAATPTGQPMPLTNIHEIAIRPERQRQEFDPQAMQDLEDSIEKIGLLHPPVLRYEGDKLVLVAGERRLRAIKNIFQLGGVFTFDGAAYYGPDIPYTDIGNLGELELEEAELDENLKRKDLTWQEHAAAVSKLHKLRSKQAHAKMVDEVASGGDYRQAKPQHTIADTAKELLGRADGAYQDQVRQELIVARHLDNPAIAGAKSAKEAMKILKAQETRSENVAMAVKIGKTFSAAAHRLEQGDCLNFMAKYISSGQPLVDVICTDPPYGMGAQDFCDAGGKMTAIEHHYDDSFESWLRLMKIWIPLSFAISKPQAHAYVFCDLDNFGLLRDMMRETGWYVFRTPLIVVKRNSGRVPLPTMGPRRQYETVLYAIKGNKEVTHIYPDIIEAAADENLSHGAQKPIAVYQNLLARSVRPGDRVADFFAGTGPIFPAAHSLKCFAIGVEQDPANYAKCVKRLQELKLLESPGGLA